MSVRRRMEVGELDTDHYEGLPKDRRVIPEIIAEDTVAFAR